MSSPLSPEDTNQIFHVMQQVIALIDNIPKDYDLKSLTDLLQDLHNWQVEKLENEVAMAQAGGTGYGFVIG